MRGTDVERALKRSGEYFFEDGLGEIVVGLWIGLTVGLPLLVLGWGAVRDVGWLLPFTSGGLLRPAILAAKARWVHPRTGRVAYPDPANAPPTLTSLGLSPADRHAAGRPPGYWATSLSYTLPGVLVVFVLLGIEQSRRLGIWGGSGHLLIGFLLAACLLFAWWRWRQRRWIVLAFALALLATAVVSSHLDWERALAAHWAGIAVALLTSGTVAFVGYLRHAPERRPEADGQ